MKKNRKEEDEEIRRAKANTSFPDMGTSVIPDANTIINAQI